MMNQKSRQKFNRVISSPNRPKYTGDVPTYYKREIFINGRLLKRDTLACVCVCTYERTRMHSNTVRFRVFRPFRLEYFSMYRIIRQKVNRAKKIVSLALMQYANRFAINPTENVDFPTTLIVNSNRRNANYYDHALIYYDYCVIDDLGMLKYR